MAAKREWLGLGVLVACTAIGAMAAGCSNSTPSLTGAGGGGGTASGAGGTNGSAGGGGQGLGGGAGTGVDGGAAGGGGNAMADAGTDGGNPTPVCTTPAATPGTWAEIAPPVGQDGFRVTDAFAAGTNNLLFAGVTRDAVNPPSNPRVLRWTAGCWTVELSIPTSTSPALTPSVHGTSASDVWATGGDLIFHRDAQGWTPFADESWRTLVHQPPSFVGPIELNRVRAVAPNQIWVAATNNMLRWDGHVWTAFNFDDPAYPNASASIGYFFRDIWIDSASSVWVASGSDQVGNTMDFGFVHHFDGANWTHTAIGLDAEQSIWHAGGVYWLATPTQDVINGQQVTRTLRRFDGTTAPTVDVAGAADALLLTLFGRGASDVWASGGDVAHFDGQSWSRVADAPAAARNTTDERNTFVTGDATSVWLSTPGPRFFRKGD